MNDNAGQRGETERKDSDGGDSDAAREFLLQRKDTQNFTFSIERFIQYQY